MLVGVGPLRLAPGMLREDPRPALEDSIEAGEIYVMVEEIPPSRIFQTNERASYQH
jgi:hypothetical protein